MKLPSISRSAVLATITVAILLVAVPGAITKIIETGDPYLFTRQFFYDIVSRLTGPGRLRFIFQPLVATFLGLRDGRRDASAGAPPFLWGLIFNDSYRPRLLRSALASIRDILCVAILLDILSQALIFGFGEIHPGAALVVGPILIAAPYTLARVLANSMTRLPSGGQKS
jgi:hypothetical protein